MSGKSFKGIGGLAWVAALSAALALFASCGAENRSPQNTTSAPPAPAPAAASNMNTSPGPAGGQNAAGAEPLQGSRFGTRLTNQSVGAGINDNANARGNSKTAGGARKPKPAGRKKR